MRSALSAVAIFVAACTNGVWAQSTLASIIGTVRDPSGAVTVGATVTAKEVETSISVHATSSGEGLFEFPNLKPGRYLLSASKSGFADAGGIEVALESRRTIRADFDLRLPTAQENVTVQETLVEINTEDGTIADSKNYAQVTQLPLNFRALGTNPAALLSTVPGVQVAGGYSISISGGMQSQVEYSIDGISTVNVRGNSPITDIYPSQESLAEFRVTSAGGGAEFGQMGDVAVITRGGTNQLHGSLIWYHQNAALDATTYGFAQKPAKVYNTFGVSLGGPVIFPKLYRGKDRTFFFADYEGNRQPGSSLGQVSVPTSAMRTGNLAGLPGGAAVDPLDGLPFPGNVVPTTRINSVAAALLKSYYPLPNYNSGSTFNNYRILAPNNRATDRYDLRIDHHIGPKQRVFARWGSDEVDAPSFFGGFLLPQSQFITQSRSLVVAHDYTLSANLLNEIRFGITRSNSAENFPIRGADAISTLGLQGLNPSQIGNGGGFPYFDFSDGTGFGAVWHWREAFGASRSVQLTDNVTWIKGRHAWKFGMDARWLRYQGVLHFGGNDGFGTFIFQQNRFGGNAFVDLLLGLPAISYYEDLGPNMSERTVHSNFYAQDRWQVSNRLTLTLGLRWQVHLPMTEDAGNISNFDRHNGNIIIPDDSLPASQGFLNGANACPGTTTSFPCTNVVRASQVGLGQGLINTHYNNWVPRFGFAYRPFPSNRTVLRGGLGLYTETLLGPSAYALTGIHTSDTRRFDNYSAPGVPPVFTLPQAYGGSLNLTTPGNSSLCCLVNPDLREPRSLQWNFSVEQALPSSLSMRVSYVGNQSSGLLKFVDLNQVPASTVPYSRSRTPYPVWTQVQSFENLGFANYQSLQSELSRRFRAGSFFQASYTLAKTVGNAANVNSPGQFPQEAPGGFVTDRFNTGLDRGDLGAQRRHRFLLTGILPLPVGKGRLIGNQLHGLAQVLAGGWDLSAVTLLQSGPFQTPLMSPGLDRSNTNLANRGALARPDRIGDGNLPNPTPDRYYDLSAFAPPPLGAGRFGNAGVGILRGPGTIAFAAGLSKTFAVTERLRLRLEGTFTNLPNHPNFVPPGVNVSQPSFGKTTSVQSAENSGNRTGQVGVRLDF